MPFRFIFYSDTHLGFDFPLTNRSKRTRRGIDFFNNFHRIYQYALENGISTLVHGGDLFYRSKIPNKLVNHVYLILHKYAAMGLKTLIVPGNHERAKLPESLLIQDKNIYIFKKPDSYTVNSFNKLICFCGFPFESGNVRSAFLRLVDKTGWWKKKADINILCLHQAVDGATVGPSNYTFRNREDVIDIDDIPDGFNMVLAGHIHRRQILTTSTGVPVIYSGSIERTSFAEKDEPKGFYDITFNSESARPCIRFIELPSRPMIIFNNNNSPIISEILEHLKKIPQNAIVRLQADNDLMFDEIRAQCSESIIFSVRNDSCVITRSVTTK
jgi:DNA repair protein SbcD/Mre11